MRFACCAVVLMACALVTGPRQPTFDPTQPTFDLPGYLQLVDRPREATPVEAMMVWSVFTPVFTPKFLIMTFRLGQTELANSF